MAADQKHPLNKQRIVLVVAVIVVAIVAGGLVLFTRWNPGIAHVPGKAIPIHVVANDNTSEATPEAGAYRIGAKLSEGQPQMQSTETNPQATGEPLSPEEVAQILARLPQLTPEPDQQVAFHLPEDVLPPPRPGNTVSQSFPPVDTAPTPAGIDTGPLQVLRFAPEGEVPVAPKISVTFNQPMVPLGTLGDLAARDVPVQVEPALAGTWRWLGAKTVTFEYDSALIDRLPKSTEYRVTVPAGTKSMTGGVLAEAVAWTFKTPPPKVVTSYPEDAPQPLSPIFFVAFDQRIDPNAVLKTVRVSAGLQNPEIILASEAEIAGDKRVRQLAKDTPEGRWLAFRATQPFPADTRISVSIGPGTPSAEGPLTTTEAQSFSFSTYAPLRIVEHGCSWYGSDCPPLTPFFIRFNNPLDVETFSDSMLSMEPAVPGASAYANADTIVVGGQTKGRTTYTVVVSGKLRDEFGQELGQDTRLTFRVGKAGSVLAGPDRNFITLDPTSSKPVFSVYAINYSKLNLKIYAVQPADWKAFGQYLGNWQSTDVPATMPGRLVEDKTLTPNLAADTLTQLDIPLDPYMKGKFGHFVVVVEPPRALIETEQDKWQRYSQTVITWVQITQIGLDAYSDHSDLLAWTTDLKDGSPLAGVSIQPNNGSATFSTGADGVARFAIPTGATYLVASRGDDQAILPRYSYSWYGDAWAADPPIDTLSWYVFDDRQMYRPGEEVHVKGWLRRIGGGQDGDVQLVGESVQSVGYQVTDSTGNPLGEGEVQVNALGGFDFVFTIPQPVNLGAAQLRLSARGNAAALGGTDFMHSFQVQEFRRPEFEVSARNETSGPYFAGDHATVAVEAKYYAGGGLPNADVSWMVTTSAASYDPPNWPDFTFGTWRPWWMFDYPGPYGDMEVESFSGKTDATGTHYLELDLVQRGDPGKDPQPKSVVAQATVMDVNRQAWSSTTTLLVHPADLYVGLRSERYFVERGTPLKVDFIVTDLDGKPVAGRQVEVTAGRLEWKLKRGEWVEQVVDVQTCTSVSATEPGTCKFETPVGGSYQITAVVTDDLGRKNQSRFTRWVSGGQLVPARKVEQEKVTLIPDKQSYQPGDTAQILVQSPFSPAEGLLTVSRSGILYTTRFRIADGSATLSIPIEEAHIPNLVVQVDLAGSAPRTDDQGELMKGVPPRPAYASGELKLSIPPTQRTLALQVTPDQQKLEPGGETALSVVVKDASGAPVPDAELAVVVVDEAILALTNYQLSDPLSVFYADRPAYLSSVYGRASIVLADPQALAKQGMRDGLAGMGGGAPMATQLAEMPAPAATQAPASQQPGATAEPIRIRSDFNPLATFAPVVRTSSNGEARLLIKLPDNLTRYRVMVVAVDNGGRQFGTGESNITARLPLMVRASPPRFLNFGDKFELPVVLQNLTDSPMTVSVAARATNLELANAGLRVSVPANDRVEVRFPASTMTAGKARVQIGATAGDYADAAVVEWPVYTPATTEAFATYGVVDEGAVAQPVLYPSGVFPQYGGLEVSTSSTALQALTDAVLYLVKYPYECSEQLASRVLAVASLRDVLTAFQADGLPTPVQMEASVADDIGRLQALQNGDGGFPYWRRGFTSIPFNTIHVTHALVRAQQKGFVVPPAMQQAALDYLRDIEGHYPAWYSQDTRWTLSAYALYVRNLAGDRDASKAGRLLREAGLENLSMEAIGWLWTVVDDNAQLDAIRQYVNNHVVETAGAANFTTDYSDQTYLLLSSDRRTDGILLDALIEDNPQSDLIPKVVNGLLAHRTKGRWENTQENVFVLLTLDRYFQTYESQTPDFVARLWLGNTYAGSSQFSGRTTDIHETSIPMNYVLSETSAAGGTGNLILSKDGPGRLYYRLGLRYAPTDLKLDPLDMGFVVQRRYEALDDPADVSQDSDGTWHIQAGARVRVHITMVADNRRYHVALVDPLPAGLEIINPALAVSENIPQDPSQPGYKYGWWWWGPWYEHQNMRDERAEAFTSLLWEGVYDYTYYARATTPGTFIVPPARAEEMYSPEVFGRSGSDLLIVK